MLVDLSRAVGAYFHEVFVLNVDWWVLLGFVAQALFTLRFVVQWIASERAGTSVIPIAFWFFSIGGGILLLGLRALSQGPGVHRRAVVRRVRLSAQPLFRHARSRRARTGRVT